MNTISSCIASVKYQQTPLEKRIVKVETDQIDRSDATDNIVRNVHKSLSTEGNDVQSSNVILSTIKGNTVEEENMIAETVSNRAINKSKSEETNIIADNNLQNCIESCTESCKISPKIIKMKHVHSTPRKMENLSNCNNINYNDEIISSSLSHRDVLSLNLKDLKYLLKSPSTSKEKEKLVESENISPTNMFSEQKKQDISLSNDRKHFDNTFKSELYDMENFHDFENIDLLHDLDTVIHFEDTKVSSDILSSMMNVNVAQETDSNLVDMNKDPLADPLFICDREETDSNVTFANLEPKFTVQRKSTRQYDKHINNVDNLSKKQRLTIEEKHLLQELGNIEEQQQLPSSVIEVS